MLIWMLDCNNDLIMLQTKNKMNKLAGLIILTILIIPVLSSAITNQGDIIRACKQNCVQTHKSALAECSTNYIGCKQSCGMNRTCSNICYQEKTACIRTANKEKNSCQTQCLLIGRPTCLNGTYNQSQIFTQGCDICECKFNGVVSCKREPFCNKNTSITEQSCTQVGGLYTQLCNGPYFDIVCSQNKFCLCKGNNNYTCPASSECLTDFISPNRRTHTIGGWKTLLGKPLGQIGICAFNKTTNF